MRITIPMKDYGRINGYKMSELEEAFTPNGRYEEFHFGSFPLHKMLKVAHAEKTADLHYMAARSQGSPNYINSMNEAVNAMRSFRGTNPQKYGGYRKTELGDEEKN